MGKFRDITKKSKVLRYLYNNSKAILNLIRYGYSEPRIYVIKDEKQLIYLANPKVATSSIKTVFYNKSNISDDYRIHQEMKGVSKLETYQKAYYKFTFVRNPYERLVSCYESKYHKDKKFLGKTKVILDFDNYLFGYIRKDKGFDNFIRKIVKIPFRLSDRHFRSQYYLTHNHKGICLVDYIGKMENIAEDFEQIAKNFDLPELGHMNQTKSVKTADSKKWMDYYTKETAELVYKKYKQDFDTFDYGNSYLELKEYLAEKNKGSSN